MSRPHLIVVTHQRWRADDLAARADVRIDLGLDTSTVADLDAVLWCPGAWAAAAVAGHPHLRLSSAGSMWPDRLPIALTGREVATSAAGELRRSLRGAQDRPVFAKLPETKHERFEAKIRAVGELAVELTRLPDDEPVQLQGPVTFEHEVRCWVRDGAVVARAVYFPGTPRENWPSLDDPVRSAHAGTWLDHALASCHVPVPPAVVIEVGWCADPVASDPGWRVVEANAPWSSDW